MKKLFLFSLLSVFLSNLHVQKIVVNDVKDGSQVILCSEERISSAMDRVAILSSLGSVTVNEEQKYFLSLTFNSSTQSFSVEKGMKLLLKLKSGEILTLETNESVQSEAKTDYSGGYVTNFNHLVVNYFISESDIEKLAGGVIKLRFEHTLDYYDKDFKKDKMGQFIMAEYVLIKELSSSSPKKSIMEDF